MKQDSHYARPSSLPNLEYTAPPTPELHNPRAQRPAIVGSDSPEAPYPVYLKGPIQRGFGRGSKDLGCPTANLPDQAIAPYTKILETGVHYGYARVDFSPKGQPRTEHDEVLPMVMSIGWNPFYKNVRRTAEVHILHEFPSDFYGHELQIVILGFIRPEYDYTSREALIDDIETDKSITLKSLDRPAYRAFVLDQFFEIV